MNAVTVRKAEVELVAARQAEANADAQGGLALHRQTEDAAAAKKDGSISEGGGERGGAGPVMEGRTTAAVSAHGRSAFLLS